MTVSILAGLRGESEAGAGGISIRPMPLNHRRCDAECLRGLTDGQMRRACDRRRVQTGPRPAQAPTRRANASQAGPDPLRYSRPFKFGQGRQNVKLICAEAHISSYVPILDMWRKAV